MLYLTQFSFPDGEREFDFFLGQKRTCHDSFYPFQILSRHHLTQLSFEPVTILYGGNGSGKTTAVNVIAQTLHLCRDTRFNQSPFFNDYTALCEYELRQPVPPNSRIITSDDVFDYMLNLRALNEGIDLRREELFQEYLDDKYSDFKYRTLEDYEQLKRVNLSRSKTQSKYVRRRLMDNPREQSNGESAFFYFTSKIEENGLYLLDEPENSLSPQRQQELLGFLEDSVRFFGCQFIIATHSPFLLSMRGARVYDLDEDPVRIRRWTQLPAVRAYYDFFRQHASAFEDGDD
ncbi:MAG: AAA family ATPase [Clostridia bacterium]|nr:AAA family ATPase [Clostridia bacterium]